MLARHCRREPSHLHDPPWLNYTCHLRLFSFFKSAIATNKIRDKSNKRQSEKCPLSCLPLPLRSNSLNRLCKEYREAHGFSDLLYSMNTTWSCHWAFHWLIILYKYQKCELYIYYIYIIWILENKNTADNNVLFLFRD